MSICIYWIFAVPVWTSYRYGLCLWVFLGGMFIYLLRINFSVAIVCMTYDPEDNTTNVGNRTLQRVIEVVDPFEDFMRIVLGLGPQSDDDCPSDEDGEVVEVSIRLFHFVNTYRPIKEQLLNGSIQM